MTLKKIQLSKDLITLARKADGVVVSPEEYDKIYSQRFMESIAKGIADGDAGRVVCTEELERQLTERRKTRK